MCVVSLVKNALFIASVQRKMQDCCCTGHTACCQNSRTGLCAAEDTFACRIPGVVHLSTPVYEAGDSEACWHLWRPVGRSSWEHHLQTSSFQKHPAGLQHPSHRLVLSGHSKRKEASLQWHSWQHTCETPLHCHKGQEFQLWWLSLKLVQQWEDTRSDSNSQQQCSCCSCMDTDSCWGSCKGSSTEASRMGASHAAKTWPV